MAVTFLIGLIGLNLNFLLIPKFGLLGAGLSMLIAILMLFTANLIIQFMDYVSYFRIVKTSLCSVVISLAVFFAVQIFIPIFILQILFYIFFAYLISVILAKKIFG